MKEILDQENLSETNQVVILCAASPLLPIDKEREEGSSKKGKNFDFHLSSTSLRDSHSPDNFDTKEFFLIYFTTFRVRRPSDIISKSRNNSHSSLACLIIQLSYESESSSPETK